MKDEILKPVLSDKVTLNEVYESLNMWTLSKFIQVYHLHESLYQGTETYIPLYSYQTFGEEQADKYLSGLEITFQMISDNPRLGGRERPDIELNHG